MWTIHYDFKKVLHVLIIIYILYVLKNCLYAMLYPMIIVHSTTRNIFLFRYSLFHQFVLYMYYMYKIFIIFLLAKNHFKDNLYYYYINCLYSMSWNFPKITMDVVTLSHILISIVNMHMCLMACELISLNTRKVVCLDIQVISDIY